MIKLKAYLERLAALEAYADVCSPMDPPDFGGNFVEFAYLGQVIFVC